MPKVQDPALLASRIEWRPRSARHELLDVVGTGHRDEVGTSDVLSRHRITVVAPGTESHAPTSAAALTAGSAEVLTR